MVILLLDKCQKGMDKGVETQTNKHNWPYQNILQLDIFLCSALDCSVLECSAIGKGYTLSNCIDQHKTWPTSLNYFTIVAFCNVLDSSVLLCSSFDYSSLNSSVLWHIVLGCCTDYQTAIKNRKPGPLFLTILEMCLTTVFLTVVYFTLMHYFAVHLTVLLHYT